MKKPITTSPNIAVKDAAKILTSKEIGSLVVIQNGEIVGIITETDLTRRVISKGLNPKRTLINNVMTKKVITINPEGSMEKAIHIMNENRIKKLPIVKNQKLVGIITTTDIVKQTEIELRKNLEELKRINQEKDDFIAMASHELKTPITTMKGFLQLLKNEDIFQNEEKRERSLDILDKEMKRLTNLITNILDFSRIDLDVMKLNLEKTQLKESLKEIRLLTDPAIKEDGLESEYIIDENLPAVIIDEDRFKQIMTNLISNAVKYTQKGKITIKASREDDFIHFEVRDTGIGIPKEEQNKIFQRFYQIDNTYTKKKSGAGIGLAICKEILEIMGGKIWVESEMGKGSNFHFRIPIEIPRKEINY
jgi:signal transduction histidine kinase